MNTSTRSIVSLLFFSVVTTTACSRDNEPIRPSSDLSTAGGSGGQSGSGGSSGSGGASGSGASTPPVVVDCDKPRRGAKMVRIERKAQGDAFCIDATETTQKEYREFQAEVGNAPSKYDSDAYCQTNNANGYAPQIGPEVDYGPQPCGSPSLWTAGTTDEQPATCVDWCDASAYCAWAGKRLCGMRDGAKATTELVPNAKGDQMYAPSVSSEWVEVCSEGNPASATKTVQPEGCVSPPAQSDPQRRMFVAVGSRDTCRGSTPPYDGVSEMAGNVWEWTAECEVGMIADGQPVCLARGPNAASPTPATGVCVLSNRDGVRGASPWTGFRCCAD